jgi:TonB family protein
MLIFIMMNKTLFIIFFLVPLISFSQSKKKQYQSLLVEYKRLETDCNTIMDRCKSIHTEFIQLYQRYQKSYSQEYENWINAVNSQEEVNRVTSDYNLIITQFNVKNATTVMLSPQFELIPLSKRCYSQLTEIKVREMPLLYEPVESSNYAKKIRLLKDNTVKMLIWKSQLESYETELKNDQQLYKGKLEELTTTASHNDTITQHNNARKDVLLSGIFEMVESIKNTKEELDIPLQLNEYFYVSDRRKQNDAKSYSPDVIWNAIEEPPPPPISDVDGLSIHTYLYTPAEYPGGITALKQYLIETIVYPESARTAGIQGTVIVKFIVNVDGNISNVVVKKGIPNCTECEKEALRVVNTMPKWVPGKNNGKVVDSFFSLPVRFILSNDLEEK